MRRLAKVYGPKRSTATKPRVTQAVQDAQAMDRSVRRGSNSRTDTRRPIVPAQGVTPFRSSGERPKPSPSRAAADRPGPSRAYAPPRSMRFAPPVTRGRGR